jgi:hypothetical protein
MIVMTLPTIVNFTPGEMRFLRHSLEVVDAIADTLADNEDDQTAAATLDKGFHLIVLSVTGKCALGLRIAQLNKIERAILRDAVEGSTYIVCIGDFEPRGVKAAAVRAGRSIVRKLRAAGFDVEDAPGI